MKKIIQTTAIFLMGMAMFTACSDEENDNDILHGEPVFFFCEASEDPLEEGFPDRTFFDFVSHEFFLSHFTGVQPAG